MLFAFQLLVVTTRPSDLMKALLTIHIPVDYVLMFVIALRFIPSLQIEGQRIHEAQLARGYNPGKGLRGKMRSVKPLLVPLVANSLGRTQVLGLTMDMRGYRSRRSVESSRLVWNKTDFAAVGCVAVTGTVVLLGGLIWSAVSLCRHNLPVHISSRERFSVHFVN